jgi:uncharacterized protein with NRDE domain
MCVAAMAWMAHPRWRLVAIGNRDEAHVRATAPLARWDNGVLAGRDLQAGGTWLGVHSNGRFALVTNRRLKGGPLPGKTSRGALVTDWLTRTPLPDLTTLNPFNLLTVTDSRAELMTNHPAPQSRTLPPGIHGLANGAPDERWFKTVTLETALTAWLERDGEPPDLLQPLGDQRPDPADPDNPFAAPFIRGEHYGTRCSSVVAVDQAGRGVIIERSFAEDSQVTGEIALNFRWPA